MLLQPMFERRGAFMLAAALLLSGTARSQFSILCDCDDAALAPCGNGAGSALWGGCINSLGAKATLDASNGSVSVAADDLQIFAWNLPVGNGLLFMGGARAQVVFGDGFQCVTPGTQGLFRFPVQTADAGGTLSTGPGLVALTHGLLPAAGHIAAGDTWYFQYWYRDPVGPCGTGFNLTNGIGITFAP
ncbi:MAG: hypothetical protein E2O39_00815 [Planctomycetota bacterium]|nr:MAG: hypothetical protein E2O39_00815 [Planctomycetota bacterium]